MDEPIRIDWVRDHVTSSGCWLLFLTMGDGPDAERFELPVLNSPDTRRFIDRVYGHMKKEGG